MPAFPDFDVPGPFQESLTDATQALTPRVEAVVRLEFDAAEAAQQLRDALRDELEPLLALTNFRAMIREEVEQALAQSQSIRRGFLG